MPSDPQGNGAVNSKLYTQMAIFFPCGDYNDAIFIALCFKFTNDMRMREGEQTVARVLPGEKWQLLVVVQGNRLPTTPFSAQFVHIIRQHTSKHRN